MKSQQSEIGDVVEQTTTAPSLPVIQNDPQPPQPLAPVAPDVQKLPIVMGESGLQLNNFNDLWRFANCVVRSGFAPKGMEKPESVVIAIQHGLEIGLSPMAALQSIAVINGRPGLFGDAALALVRASGKLESYKEEMYGVEGKDDYGCRATTKRKGEEKAEQTFTIGDAKRANLWGKAGPWQNFPARMLRWRARGFLLRDVYGDVLKGLKTVEELQDIAPIDVTPAASQVMPTIGGKPITPTPSTFATEPGELIHEEGSKS